MGRPLTAQIVLQQHRITWASVNNVITHTEDLHLLQDFSFSTHLGNFLMCCTVTINKIHIFLLTMDMHFNLILTISSPQFYHPVTF